MAHYRRADDPGGTFFLTLVAHRRRPIFTDAAARDALHAAIAHAAQRHPFTLLQFVLLPDHLHLILRLPRDDADFSTRIASIKSAFTRQWLATGGVESTGSASRRRQRYRGVWQKRFWKHTVRDAADLARCEAYVWYNPVEHGLASCPHAWPWSSFHREVSAGCMPRDWCCICDGQSIEPPADIAGAEGEGLAGEWFTVRVG